VYGDVQYTINGMRSFAMKYCRSILTALCVVAITAYSQPVPIARPTSDIPLTIFDGQTTLTNRFGVFPEAHFCIVSEDSINGHQEYILPPSPPGVFDTRMMWPRTGSESACFDLGSQVDYRMFWDYLQRDTFRVGIAFPAQLPAVLSWPANLGLHFRKLLLKDVATGGAAYTVDILADTSVSLIGDPLDVRIYGGAPRTAGDTIEIAVTVAAGWNLISIPVKTIPSFDSVRTMFPGSVFPYVFDFSSGYTQRYRPMHGKGYWGKFSGPQTFRIRGLGYNSDTINVVTGWNFIGTPFYPVSMDSIRTIPPGIINNSRFFRYTGGYSTEMTELLPGRGYIIKCSSAGKIIMPPAF
jgi:hypothetical protein